MIQRETKAGDLNTSTKQETINTTTSDSTLTKISSSSSSSSWSRLKDPRIVRVSRAFGGKDRHSKVCTVRGLRDRRVRLSVPTAIQLYDLQDRLGLNQPSKVVDWLLDVAKHEIDELPPLQIPPGAFPHQYHPMLMNHSPSDKLKILNWNNVEERSSDAFHWNAGKSKDVGSSGVRDHHNHDHDHNNWTARASSSHHQGQEDQRQEQLIMTLDHDQNLSSNINFLSRLQNNNNSHPSNPLSNLLANGSSYNSFLIRSWDPSNLTLSHPPRAHHQSSEALHNFSLVPLPSSTLDQQQVLVYQPGEGMSTQSYFPSSTTEFDPKNLSFQANNSTNSSVDHHEESNATQSVVRPFHFSTVDLIPSENDHHQQNKRNDFRLG